MPFREDYRRQVALLIRTIPAIAEEDCFALKGGTAINLFLRNLPRLSVDIDLTFLPAADRPEALAAIDQGLKRIARRIENAIPRVTIQESAPSSQDSINKLVVRTPDRIQTKIEVTPVLRGCVYEPELMSVSEQVEEQFGFAETNVLSFADLYAGKITAALDRQHPRDLFDIHELLGNEGLTNDLRTALVVYLISHDHAPHQLLSSDNRDIRHEFDKDFIGMTPGHFALESLLSARTALVEDVLTNMPDDHKRFLASFYRRDPEWHRLGLPGADQLPAVRWRELNLDKAGEATRAFMVSELEKVLWP